jgi:hypothetical protein
MDDSVPALADRPAFELEEQRFDCGDLILAATGWGEWQVLERTLADELARVAAAARRNERPTDDDLRTAVIGFRRARQLMAGEDYRRWLERRSLSAADVTAHLCRAAAGRHVDVDVGEPARADRPSRAELTTVIGTEAILSGRLRAWGIRLARCAGAARALQADDVPNPPASDAEVDALVDAAVACGVVPASGPQARGRATRIAGLLAAERRFREHAVTAERVERCLAEHRLDWQRLWWQEVTFVSEGAAREGALWVRDQGTALDEVAELGGVPVATREAYGCDVPQLSGVLSAATPGELVGPLRADRGWRLLLLSRRSAPAATDGVVVERAADEIVTEALERHLAGRLSWRGEL